MRIFIFIGVCTMIFLSCAPSGNQRNPKTDELIDIDSAFSAYSATNCYQAAFIEYCAEDAVILKDHHHPIKGKAAITAMYESNPDSNSLTWQPVFAKLAASGDLGYTYGYYQYKVLQPGNKEKITAGTYVTIWEKQKDGNWKFVLDAGNEGLGK